MKLHTKLSLGECAVVKTLVSLRMRTTGRDVECCSFCQDMNASSLSTGKLLHYYCLLWIYLMWLRFGNYPKMYSTEQQQKNRRKGGRQRGGGKHQGSFAKQIQHYPFVWDATKTSQLIPILWLEDQCILRARTPSIASLFSAQIY